MVDSIGPSSQIQNVSGTNRTQKTAETEQKNTDNRTISDNVSLSSEALSLSQAQEATQNIATQLSQNTDITLSEGNSERLNTIA